MARLRIRIFSSNENFGVGILLNRHFCLLPTYPALLFQKLSSTTTKMATEVLKVSNREEDQMNNEPSMSGTTKVGVIIPPPDIKGLFAS